VAGDGVAHWLVGRRAELRSRKSFVVGKRLALDFSPRCSFVLTAVSNQVHLSIIT